MSKVWKNVAATLGLVAVSVVASATTVHVIAGGRASGRTTSEIAGSEVGLSAEEYGFHNTALSLGQRPVGSAPDLTPAAESSVKAVVHIKVQKEQRVEQQMMDPFEFFFGGDPRNSGRRSQPVVGYGSGVIISDDGYIMTNNHVVEGGEDIKVTLNDNRTFTAKLVGADAGSDIALLKIEGKDFPTIPFGNSDNLRLGEWVLAVGNPFNLTSTVTAGIVSAKSRSTASAGDQLEVSAFIQTDAAVNPGNSGGALVNAAGELIGINTMIYSQTGNYAGYSFAVPINIAAKVVSDIKKYGSVQRGVLGVVGSEVTSELVQKEGLKVNEGFYVADFAEISAALAAGIEKGDVITAIAGHKITSFGQLQEQLSRFRPGDKIDVQVNRKGAEKTFKVTLRNMEGGASILKQSSALDARLGATLRPLEADARRSYGLSYGLVVESLRSGALKNAGIREGFILLTANDNPLRSVADLNKSISPAKGKTTGRRSGSILILRGFYPQSGDVVTYTVEL
nr:Do family serine endopeptidase [uncultured Porphyromonas sp.]